MSRRISRRTLLLTAIGTAAGTGAVGQGIRLAARHGLVPPDHTGVYGIGETLTYAAQRLLIGRESLAREFSRADISNVAPVNGPPPDTERYQVLSIDDFRDWRLEVNGLVERPATLSLDQIKSYPAHTQITHQACEEGWSFIAEWTGVRLSYVLDLVGIRPSARYVVFFPFDQFWESIDMSDALHPQTLLAYDMNGGALPPGHGAPLRLRVARQLGYKSIKYLSRMTVVDSVKPFGKGTGGANPEWGYSWWAGI